MKINLLFLFIILGINYSSAQTELPDLTLKNLAGEEVLLRRLSEEKPVVVSLWATWCVPCVRELDTISEEYAILNEEEGFTLYAISVDDQRSVRRVKPAVLGKGWEFEVLLDTNNDLRRFLGNPTIPLTLIVKDNEIVFRHSSFSPGAEQQLYEAYRKISGE
jgi:peroxiredoxin